MDHLGTKTCVITYKDHNKSGMQIATLHCWFTAIFSDLAQFFGYFSANDCG